jgi:PAS domain S-box-containing protein
LMNNLPDHIYFKDLQSRFLRINKAQAQHLNLKDPAEALGKTDFDFFAEEHARPAFEDEQRIIRTGRPILDLEEKEVYPDGRVTWASTTKMPLRDPNGQIIGTFGITRDITAAKQQEIEQERLATELARRALQLQTAAEVSRAASSILDLNELIPQAVNLIRDRFNLYYAGLFLLDDQGKFAVLKAGTGDAGRQMVEAGYRLEVGSESMIGWCITNRKALIALDVGTESIRFENPLLPATRTELALPLVARDRVIGAITVQSDQEAAGRPIGQRHRERTAIHRQPARRRCCPRVRAPLHYVHREHEFQCLSKRPGRSVHLCQRGFLQNIERDPGATDRHHRL